MMTAIYAVIFVFVLVGVYLYRRSGREARRRRLLSRPMSEEWKGILEKNMPLYKLLGEELRKHLEGLVNVFVSEKKFEGSGNNGRGEGDDSGAGVCAIAEPEDENICEAENNLCLSIYICGEVRGR